MASWVVIDTNMLRRQPLEDFLAADDLNRAVFTEYTSMESFKGDSLDTLRRSLKTISRRSGQAVILRHASVLIRAQWDRVLFRDHLVDLVTTREFRRFLRGVHDTSPPPGLLAELIRRRLSANSHLSKVRAGASTLASEFKAIGEDLGPRCLKALRTDAEVELEDLESIKGAILNMAVGYAKAYPGMPQHPSIDAFPHNFSFRYAVVTVALAIDWLARGGLEQASPETLANDVADSMNVAFATYFDGLLTTDARAKRVYSESVQLLRLMFDIDPRAPVQNVG